MFGALVTDHNAMSSLSSNLLDDTSCVRSVDQSLKVIHETKSFLKYFDVTNWVSSCGEFLIKNKNAQDRLILEC